MSDDSASVSIAAVRAPRPEEAASVASLLNEVTAGWIGWPPTDGQAVSDRWRAPSADRERDFRVSVSPQGRMVGYSAVFRTRSDRIWAELRTVDDEVAAHLLQEVERRARELAALDKSGRRVVLRSQVEERQRAVANALRRRGFEIVREALRVVIPVAEQPSEPQWPAGISVRSFDASGDARPVHALSMTALADTWEFEAESYEQWHEDWVEGAGFDPSLWTVAEHEGEIVGLAQCRYEPPGSQLGWFELLAVDRKWRRQGLGQALLLHALRRFYERGTTRVGLGVDPENPTGAFRVATAAGGEVVQRFWTFEREVTARRARVGVIAGKFRTTMRRAAYGVTGRTPRS